MLPGGTTVLCSMASANRDERAFDDADEMDLARRPNTHLSFGVGPHSCLGQALARTELQVVLEVLLRRLPTLELAVPAEELRRVEGLVVGGLRRASRSPGDAVRRVKASTRTGAAAPGSAC